MPNVKLSMDTRGGVWQSTALRQHHIEADVMTIIKIKPRQKKEKAAPTLFLSPVFGSQFQGVYKSLHPLPSNTMQMRTTVKPMVLNEKMLPLTPKRKCS